MAEMMHFQNCLKQYSTRFFWGSQPSNWALLRMKRTEDRTAYRNGFRERDLTTRKLEIVTEELCGKSFSKSTVSSLCQRLEPIVEAFRNRPLNKRYPFLIVDAIYLKVREGGRVRSKDC